MDGTLPDHRRQSDKPVSLTLTGRTTTCTAGAGSLLLEFSLLSRLVGDPSYELAGRRAARQLYSRRHEDTGLLGTVLDVNTGEWSGKVSGLGAGIDRLAQLHNPAHH